MLENNQFPRGAEWRQWDLHIHTPASYHWKGERFESNFDCNQLSEKNIKLIDEMIRALNEATPDVFCIMDYWTFDGWFALKKRMQNLEAPKLTKRVFPGIELRLAAPKLRLNAHVLFSDKIEDQFLKDFQSNLKMANYDDRNLSKSAIIGYARKVGEDILKKHGHKKTEVDLNDEIALLAGSKIAEINPESYKTAIKKIPNNQAVGFMPYDTTDGLEEVDWKEHYPYFMELFESSPIFETRKEELRNAFVGEETVNNEKYFESFQRDLKNIPRLAVSGSDAHRFIGIKGDNNNRGYGNFPSNKITWIKADPTFKGLLQAIKEPSKRSYIGEKPDKLRIVEENKTFFIDELSISKINAQSSIGEWFDGVKIPLNSDLVAIIGGKGSGKSAIADIIALLGSSNQHESFSFLNEKRFRGKAGNLAKHFNADLTWKGGASNSQNLNKNSDEGSVELIRYLPQSYFENLCNEHTDDGHKKFQSELRKVIFNHIDISARLEASDFDQLVDRQEKTFRDQLDEYRKNLARINLDIQGLEQQTQARLRKQLEELLELKTTQITGHDKIKPETLPKPSEEQSLEQQEVSEKIEENAKKLLEIATNKAEKSDGLLSISKKLNALKAIRDGFQMLERQYSSFQESNAANFEILGLQQDKLVRLEISNLDQLSVMKTALEQEEKESHAFCAELENQRSELILKQTELKKKLNEPQLLYQKNCEDIKRWEEARIGLIGPENSAANQETLNGLKASIADLDKIPSQLDTKRKQRLQLTGEIFNALNAQREARERLFKPLQDFIEKHPLIKEDNKLKFQSNLNILLDALIAKLFEIIKQYSGEFNKDNEGHIAIKQLSESCSFNSKDDVLKFVQELDKKIAGSDKLIALRKDKTSSEVYDLVFGLSYLEPQYSLLFEEAEIAQLSPGQRGALLLIFYLLVDKGQRPIVLDQPEENLDNETVFSLLAPVIIEAKKQRQIIMVTHNPNLAIVCDAEQIIYSSFDRKIMKASYTSGSIENPIFNGHAVNVLEGTKPAFDNRKDKYH